MYEITQEEKEQRWLKNKKFLYEFCEECFITKQQCSRINKTRHKEIKEKVLDIVRQFKARENPARGLISAGRTQRGVLFPIISFRETKV